MRSRQLTKLMMTGDFGSEVKNEQKIDLLILPVIRVGTMTTMASIDTSKIGQYHHENLTWIRSLDFFKQENAYLKTRLSEVVDQVSDPDFLAQAEHFQNQFIIKDEFIRELQHDINRQEKELKDNYLRNPGDLEARVLKRQDKLRNEIEYLEKDFARMRNEFNKYLSSVL